jgi:hypothetical protein
MWGLPAWRWRSSGSSPHAFKRPSVAGVYRGFLSALAIWGWIELAFLTGVVTGPVNQPLLAEAPRNGNVSFAPGAPSPITRCCWPSRVSCDGLRELRGREQVAALDLSRPLRRADFSAKLNLYFGVPKINTEFIPEHLNHLPSHFRTARMNWLFPISITGLTLAPCLGWSRFRRRPAGPNRRLSLLVTRLTALALLEHWLMVLPLPDERLWRWMLPATEGLKRNDNLKIPGEETMDFDNAHVREGQLDALKEEGNYRIFAELNEMRFPGPRTRSGAPTTISAWASTPR